MSFPVYHIMHPVKAIRKKFSKQNFMLLFYRLGAFYDAASQYALTVI